MEAALKPQVLASLDAIAALYKKLGKLQDASVEAALAMIWSEVLRVERVGRHDSFFNLGGQSLLALRVIFLVNDYFLTELTVRTLLENPVLKDFADTLLSVSGRNREELERVAEIGIMVRRMTPDERKAALKAVS